VFNEIAARVMPADVKLLHFVDESTIKNTIAAGYLQKATMRQVIRLVGSAFDAGCDVAMVTCSSIGKAVEMAAELYDQPVLRVDRAMAEKAVSIGKRIGVVATVKTTLEPTVRLIRKKAAEHKREVTVIERVAEEAFEALLAGDTARHDEILKQTIVGLADEVDVVVLAQVSMARLVPSLGNTRVPVLSSPQSGVKMLIEALQHTR